MGSGIFDKLKEQNQPITRGGGETMVGPPEAFTIVGLDISPEKLIALYPETHKRSRAIILGIRDKTRALPAKVPAAFVATFSQGCEEAITVANLGPDKKGRIWIVVCKGRNRDMALRAWNAANPANTWDITAILKPFTHNEKAGIDAELEALESNARSNVFVAELPSTKADRAFALGTKGKSAAAIAITIGARDAEQVESLKRVARCHQDVKDALDADKITIEYAASLADKDEIDQCHLIRRKSTKPGNGKAARAVRDAAAPPRPKAKPGPYVRKLVEHIRLPPGEEEGIYTTDEAQRLMCDLVEHITGGATASWLVGPAAAAKGAMS